MTGPMPPFVLIGINIWKYVSVRPRFSETFYIPKASQIQPRRLELRAADPDPHFFCGLGSGSNFHSASPSLKKNGTRGCFLTMMNTL